MLFAEEQLLALDLQVRRLLPQPIGILHEHVIVAATAGVGAVKIAVQ
jgi:hypothetical protein